MFFNNIAKPSTSTGPRGAGASRPLPTRTLSSIMNPMRLPTPLAATQQPPRISLSRGWSVLHFQKMSLSRHRRARVSDRWFLPPGELEWAHKQFQCGARSASSMEEFLAWSKVLTRSWTSKSWPINFMSPRTRSLAKKFQTLIKLSEIVTVDWNLTLWLYFSDLVGNFALLHGRIQFCPPSRPIILCNNVDSLVDSA